jgi:hypothetical protein
MDPEQHMREAKLSDACHGNYIHRSLSVHACSHIGNIYIVHEGKEKLPQMKRAQDIL